MLLGHDQEIQIIQLDSGQSMTLPTHQQTKLQRNFKLILLVVKKITQTTVLTLFQMVLF